MCVLAIEALLRLSVCMLVLAFTGHSRGARDSKIGKKWPDSSRILDYILSKYGVSEV